VNGPLFATAMLGMFWKRATGHGAFAGLSAGTIAAFVHHGLTLPHGAAAGIKGGWLGVGPLHVYPSEMAHAFGTAIWAWSICFVVTIVVSLLTRRNRTDGELQGLVYSLTPKPKDEAVAWPLQPMNLGLLVLGAALVMNVIFF
jgi:SSS family solute:Na+ symporter